MARIELPEKGWVPSPVWEVYTSAENRLGYIPNTLKATSHSLRSLRAIDHLIQAHEEQGTLEPELRIFASLAAAHRNQNEYGVAQILRQARRFFLAEEKLDAILQDRVEETLFSPQEIAVVRFARAMTERADAGEAALAEIRQYLSEEKVVELTFIVAGRNFLDRIQCTFDVDTEPEVMAERN
jgi:alkylhydroperoxidase family enzyme